MTRSRVKYFFIDNARHLVETFPLKSGHEKCLDSMHLLKQLAKIAQICGARKDIALLVCHNGWCQLRCCDQLQCTHLTKLEDNPSTGSTLLQFQ